MTDEQAEALGRRALAAGFEWAPGCLAVWLDDGQVSRVLWGPHGGDFATASHDPAQPLGIGDCDWMSPGDAWPDLRDAATLGVLVAQVRERWGTPHAYAAYSGPYEGGFEHLPTGWSVWGLPRWSGTITCHATEAEAWVAALEAAR